MNRGSSHNPQCLFFRHFSIFLLIELREDGQRMMNGNLDFTYTVNASPHSECGDTPCVESFPNDIITVRPDGIVVMNTKECIACEAFTWECPHDSIRIHVNYEHHGKMQFVSSSG